METTDRPLGTDEVLAFVSCSVRASDKALIDALERDVLQRLGFRCVTVGRNVGGPMTADAAIKQWIDQAHCLIGVATARLAASEISDADAKFILPTPYLVQESAMAFQRGIPMLMLRASGVTLPAVTGTNLWLEIAPQLSNGRAKFLGGRDLVLATLRDLKAKALQRKNADGHAQMWQTVGKMSTAVVAVGAATKLWGAVFGNDAPDETVTEAELLDAKTKVSEAVLGHADHHRLGGILAGNGVAVPARKAHRIAALHETFGPSRSLLRVCLSVPELRNACRELKVPSSGSKEDMLERLLGADG